MFIIVSTLPTYMNSLTKLNGTNYENWVEFVKLFLAVFHIDIALIEDEPPISTDESSTTDRAKCDKWAH